MSFFNLLTKLVMKGLNFTKSTRVILFNFEKLGIKKLKTEEDKIWANYLLNQKAEENINTQLFTRTLGITS